MAVSAFVIDPAHPCLAGHFPGNPVVPGVVIVDRVLAVIEAAHGTLPALQLPQVKFVRPLYPGQVAHIDIQPVPREQGRRWRVRVSRDDEVLASLDIIADAAA